MVMPFLTEEDKKSPENLERAAESYYDAGMSNPLNPNTHMISCTIMVYQLAQNIH